MKLLSTTLSAAAVTGLILAGSAQAADDMFTEVGSADLNELTLMHDDSNSKPLMIVYYEDDCAVCNDLALSKTAAGDTWQQSFALYKTDVAEEFSIVCPNGTELSDNNFMMIKGIEKLPAVVITDEDGNVIHVENGVDQKDRLAAIGRQMQTHQVATGNAQ